MDASKINRCFKKMLETLEWRFQNADFNMKASKRRRQNVGEDYKVKISKYMEISKPRFFQVKNCVDDGMLMLSSLLSKRRRFASKLFTSKCWRFFQNDGDFEKWRLQIFL